MPPFLLQLIRDLHTGTTARVRTPHGMSDVFYTTSGVRQGCILAPVLFCCAIDWLMQHCSGCFGVDVGNFHLTDINYADDAVLFTDDPMKLDYVFRNFEASAGWVSTQRRVSTQGSPQQGLHTNWYKTKIQNIGTGDAQRTIHIDNQAVETVSKFTYLGSDIDSEGYSQRSSQQARDPEIRRRLDIAGSIMAQCDNVWRQQRLSLSTKLRIYTSLVQSVVLYGSETWTMRKVDSDRSSLFICRHCVVSLVS